MNQFQCDQIRLYAQAAEMVTQACSCAINDIIDGRPPRDFSDEVYADIIELGGKIFEEYSEVRADELRMARDDAIRELGK